LRVILIRKPVPTRIASGACFSGITRVPNQIEYATHFVAGFGLSRPSAYRAFPGFRRLPFFKHVLALAGAIWEGQAVPGQLVA